MTSPVIPLRWLDGAAPAALPDGATFGVPVPRGAVASATELALTADGEARPAQFWPLATWPDGSVKWAGVAVPAGAFSTASITAGENPAPAEAVTVTETDESVTVANGLLELVVPRKSANLFTSLSRDGRIIAENGRLVSALADGPSPRDTRTEFGGFVTDVTVEQTGPVRAVVKVQGHHIAIDRERLPFTVRFTVIAGSDSVRLVHSFIWDADANTEFLAALGITADVPLRAETHNRHVRFATAGGGVFAEAVRGLTGLRRDPGAAVREAQIAGRATAPVAEWDAKTSTRLHWIPEWDDFTLSQLSSDGYEIHKRTASPTNVGRAWIKATAGTRAEGLASLSDPEGGFGIGVRGFWQSYPGQLDIAGAAGDAASVTAWLYSPDAAPADMRFYHDGLGQSSFADQLDALEITYEDYEPGFGDPHGIARTHELTLFAWNTTPTREDIADRARLVQQPALPQATPEHIHSCGVFGDWGLVDRSTPIRTEIEDSLDLLTEFYLGQPEQRRWYGFWDYGDVMHAYDFDRHTWRYDIGGYAWDNSELSPDLWLWYSYLRTGRADIFRFAEAMTRHTGEVDVYHLGRFKGLGSRHNVQHWGCSAKQLRISTPAYRRFYHYLTADERVGDLLDELRDSDETFLGLDPVRKVRPDAATYRADRNAVAVGLGTDWSALAATWLADWERTGNERSRDRLLGTMADIGAMKNGFLTGEALYDLDTGRFQTDRDRIRVSHLSAVFGLVEICSELISLVDIPSFREAWVTYCSLFLASPEEQVAAVGEELTGIHLEQAHSRLTAYAAVARDDQGLRELAWHAFDGMGEWLLHRNELQINRIDVPAVPAPVDEMPTVSTNDAAQFGLAAIQMLALLGDQLDSLAAK